MINIKEKLRDNGLYWVFFGHDWTVAQYQYCEYNEGMDWKVIGCDVERGEHDIETIGDMLTPSTKPATITNGSKYSYTEKVGDNMVSYGFDTFEELRNFVISHRKGEPTT